MEVIQQTEDKSDASLSAIASTMGEKQKPIRVRIPLQLWDGRQYVAWAQESWKVDVKDGDEAKQLKDAMDLFFATLGRCGANRTMAALQAEQEQPE